MKTVKPAEPDSKHPAAELSPRRAPIDMTAGEFRELGHRAVERVAELLESLAARPITRGETPSEIRALLPQGPLPAGPAPAAELLEETATNLFDHSLFNGHPRFLGYITAPAAPIGVLGELLAAAVNPNLGGWALSPLASEIETQTVRWIAELLGFPASCGGLLVSGGNMANFVGFLAARRAAATWEVRSEGLSGHPPLTVYVSEETHTWIQKATDLFGLGTRAIRWIETDSDERMRVDALEDRIAKDRAAGSLPFLVVGTAGTVGLGAVDPLPAIAATCRKQGIWFHVDGAYGAPAAALPEASEDLKGLSLADSVAVDPHKWLYSPLEAGCALVREPAWLAETFHFAPPYYHFEGTDEEPRNNYHTLGMQNSRGFRALKVWLALRQVGRDGYVRLIREDIALARALSDAIARREELEAVTQNLSVTTFRFVPKDLAGRGDHAGTEAYLNELNEAILERLQKSGEIFLSNAVRDGRYLLRACVVNFRTTLADVEAVPAVVERVGREVHAKLTARE